MSIILIPIILIVIIIVVATALITTDDTQYIEVIDWKKKLKKTKKLCLYGDIASWVRGNWEGLIALNRRKGTIVVISNDEEMIHRLRKMFGERLKEGKLGIVTDDYNFITL